MGGGDIYCRSSGGNEPCIWGVETFRSNGGIEPCIGGWRRAREGMNPCREGQETEKQKMERSPAGEGETGSEKREGTPAGKKKGKNMERRQ